MRQEVQWYLTERLVEARTRPVPPGWTTTQHRMEVLAAFGASLEAFRYVEELNADEVAEWGRRMFQALGVQVPESRSAGSSAIYVGDEPRREPSWGPSLPQFPTRVDGRRLGSCRSFGANLTIDEIEYDDSVTAIRWTVSGAFDVEDAFPQVFADLQADVDGMDDWAADLFREKTRDNLRFWRVPKFDLVDDVGTEYNGRPQTTHGHAQAGDYQIDGLTLFVPGTPAHAKRLRLDWHGSTIEVDLTRA